MYPWYLKYFFGISYESEIFEENFFFFITTGVVWMDVEWKDTKNVIR